MTSEQLTKVGNASTYSEILTDVLLPILERKEKYKKFQKSGESSAEDRAQIDRPTLLLTALDDPFHHPELCGFATNTVESPNLVYMITEEGGHVSWP